MSAQKNAPAAVDDADVVTEIPDELKKLAKYVVRGFYSVEHILIVDLLIRNVIMKDEDLAELLKFDKKQLRIMLQKLRSDKLLKSTQRVETQADGKTSRQYYYFINYKIFVNVVKYRLDRMRHKIESRERESTCKALYRCANTECGKQYNEYDVGDLTDFMTGEMRCTICGQEVLEDETLVPEKDTFMQIALFNEQMRPLFDLLKVVEHVKLAPEVLEPTPGIGNSIMRANQAAGIKGQCGWSGSKPNYALYNQEVTINMGDDKERAGGDEKKVAKERPRWMVESTVEGAVTEDIVSIPGGADKMPSATSKSVSHNQAEIMRALLVHESKTASRTRMSAAPVVSDNESDESASDEEGPTSSSAWKDESRPFAQNTSGEMEVDDEDDDDEEEEVMVSVRGCSVPFNEVSGDHVAEMTLEEKDVYIRLGQEVYAAMHE